MAGELIRIHADRLHVSLDNLRYPLVRQTSLTNVPPTVDGSENRPVVGGQCRCFGCSSSSSGRLLAGQSSSPSRGSRSTSIESGKHSIGPLQTHSQSR